MTLLHELYSNHQSFSADVSNNLIIVQSRA
jgi:hypothetical protein